MDVEDCSFLKVDIHFSLEKIILRMRSAENFPFHGKFSEVYIHLKIHC